MMSTRREVTRNFLALTGDFVLFSIGFAFFDPLVIVPAFVKQFTGSDLMVGALSMARVLMITVPQIWAASFLNVRPRKKPLLVWSSVLGRAPLLLLMGATFLWTDSALWLVIGVLLLSTMLFYTSEGLNGVSWPALVGKVIPEKLRGRFFGLGQLLSSASAGVAGYVVTLILGEEGASSPTRWSLLFGFAFVALMLSAVSMLFIRETAEEKAPARIDVRESLGMMMQYLRTDRSLRRMVIAQLVMSTAAATFPFFIVRARERVLGGDALIGAFLTTQSIGGVVAAIVGGYLVDRVGSWAAIRLSAAVEVGALITVTLAGVVGASQGFYFVAFFLLGFVTASSWWSFSAYLLDMASEERRPIYLATSGILISVTVLNPMIAGALFELLLPEVVFAGACVLAVVGLALAWTLSKSRAEFGGVDG